MWTEEVVQAMHSAGWRAERRADVEAWQIELEQTSGFEMHEAARRFLCEFGGLEVHASGPGKVVAKMGFKLDPMLCVGQKSWFESLCPQGRLYPLGEEEDGNASIAIALDSNVYLLFGPVCELIGRGSAALANLIEGVRER